MKNWIIIADAARAAIFVPHVIGKKLQTVCEFSHPQSRAKNADILADRASQTQHARSAQFAPTMTAPTEPKMLEAEQFAKALAHELKHASDRHEFDRLALVAPPHFLGLLREALDEQVARKVVASLQADLTRIERHQLWTHLTGVIHSLSQGTNV